MKKKIALVFGLIVITNQVFAQVSVTTNGTPPDQSAMLDVKSSGKGVLIPRMTTAQRNGISNPATGLLIFCTDNNFYYSNRGTPVAPNWVLINTQWLPNGSSIYYNEGSVGIGITDPTHSLAVVTGPNGNALRLIGSQGYYGYGARLDFGDGSFASIREDEDDKLLIYALAGTRMMGGNVGIGTTSPHISAAMEISSLNKGFLPPRLTTAQQNTSIPMPAEGLIIYNTDTKTINVFNGTNWIPLVPVNVNWACGEPFVDYRDNRAYNTVQIGDQCWMAQNLNVGIRINSYVEQTANSVIEKYCYNNDVSNCEIYGGLYLWDEMMNYSESSNNNPSSREGICPEGWHVPSDAEWCQMEIYLDPTVVCEQVTTSHGTDIGNKLKESGMAHWEFDSGATNSSGFTALPGGSRMNSGTTNSVKAWAYIWTSRFSYYRGIYAGSSNIYRNAGLAGDGMSVRCVKQ